MSYILKLTDTYTNDIIALNMNLSESGVDYSIPSPSGYSVICDHSYKVTVLDDKTGIETIPGLLYLNDEEVELDFSRGNFLFSDSYGVCRLEISFGPDLWVSDSITVMVKDDSLSSQVKNMVEYIYNNCEQFIYEDHHFSKLEAGFKNSVPITLDSRLALLDEIEKYYIDSYLILKNSPTNELVSKESVDPFEKVQYLNSNSLRYIATHPDILNPTNYNTGISVSKQNYMPSHALNTRFVPTRNTYENQIVIGFLTEIISALRKMSVDVNQRRSMISKPKTVTGYIDSSYEIMMPGIRALEKYQIHIQNLQLSFSALLNKYKTGFQVDFIPVKCIPKCTNVFRSVPIYNKIFSLITKWFSHKSYDMKKTDFILSFLSTSKIYEYYTLIKLKTSIEKLGYKSIDSVNRVFKYPEIGYYTNTKFQNTFEFSSGKDVVNLYFQPIIYTAISNDFNYRPNGIDLYLTTMIKANKKYSTAYYTPDFIIAHRMESKVSYHILDAKFSTFKTIVKYSLADLVFKYVFSLSPVNDSDTIDSLILIFGKELTNTIYDVHNVAKNFHKKMSHSTYFVACNGDDVEDNGSLVGVLEKILEANKDIT